MSFEASSPRAVRRVTLSNGTSTADEERLTRAADNWPGGSPYLRIAVMSPAHPEGPEGGTDLNSRSRTLIATFAFASLEDARSQTSRIIAQSSMPVAVR